MLQADPIEVERGGRLALSAPGFEVAAGQAGVLRGPNGAGKSTLLRALAGLAPLSAGDARLDQLSLRADRDEFAAHVAYAGHLDAVKPALSVRENLAAWAALYETPASGLDPALAAFNLTAIADTSAAYCSAGQKRRLGLARLLVMNRPVWLLDEPTVSLDAASVALFANAVSAHCAGGGIALAATHIEIGLPAGPRIDIDPPAEATADESDPFLTGAWA